MRTGTASGAALMGQLGLHLITAGHLSETQLDAALERKRQNGGFLGEVLIEMGFVSAKTIGQILEEAIGVPYVDLSEMPIEPHVLELVSEQYQRRHRVMPYKIEGRRLYVAMTDPLHVMVIDDLHMMTGLKVVPQLAIGTEILDALNRAYSARSAAESVLREIEDADHTREEQEMSAEQLADLAEDAPIIRLTNSIIAGAVNGSASDIHIEPQE